MLWNQFGNFIRLDPDWSNFVDPITIRPDKHNSLAVGIDQISVFVLNPVAEVEYKIQYMVKYPAYRISKDGYPVS